MYIAGRIFLRKIPPAHGVENTCDENVPNPHLTPQKNNLHSENIPVKKLCGLTDRGRLSRETNLCRYFSRLCCLSREPVAPRKTPLSLSLSLLPPASLPRMNG